MHLSDKQQFSISIVLLIILNFFVSFYYFYYTNQSGLDTILLFSTILLIFLGVWRGVLFSLGMTLLFIFSLGTYMIFSLSQNTNVMNQTQDFVSFSILNMVAWQIILLISAFIAGNFHSKRKTLIDKYQYWKEQYHQLVTIDPQTTFDNEKRFYMQLNESFKKAKRYDHSFSLLLIQFKNWDSFHKLYGDIEAEHILKVFSNQIQQTTRASDSRFRISEDTFALILPETKVEGIEIVIKKMTDKMRDFPLSQKNKMVTIEFAFGYSTYQKQLDDYKRMFYDALDELNNYVA